LKNLAIDDPSVNIGTFSSEYINKVLVFSNSGDYLATNLELNDIPTISVWYSSLNIPKPTIKTSIQESSEVVNLVWDPNEQFILYAN